MNPAISTALRLSRLIADQRLGVGTSLVAAGVMVACYGVWTARWQSKSPDMFCLDFHKVWRAAARLDAGENPYAAAAKFPAALWAGGRVGDQDQSETLAYPPLVPVLVLPLSRLPWDTAAKLWTWFNIGLLVAAIWLAARAADPEAAWLPVPLYVLAAGLWTVRLEFQIGNTEVVLLFCFAAAARALRAGREGLAGAMIGLSAAVKLAPLLLLLGPLVAGRLRAVAVGLAVACGLTFAALAFMGWDTWSGFWTAYSFKVNPTFLAVSFNQSLTGLLLRVLTDPTAGSLVTENGGVAVAFTGAAAAAVALTAVFAAIEYRLRSEWTVAGLAWSIATMLLVNPFVFYDYSVELFLGLAVIGADIGRGGSRLRVLLLLGSAVAVHLIGLRSSDMFNEAGSAAGSPLPAAFDVLWPNRVWLGNAAVWAMLLAVRLQARAAPASHPRNP